MLTVAFSMLSLATKTHTSFGITLMHHKKYSDAHVIKIQEYLIDNIFVEFGWRIFQQTIGIPMGTNCAPLLADLFFILVWGGVCAKSPQSRQETPCTTIQFHLQILDDVLSLNKHKICRVFGIHLSTWTWNKGNNRDCILGLLSLQWQWKAYY